MLPIFERIEDVVRSELGFPKRPREKSPKYLKHVRSLRCVVPWCNQKTEPHHLTSRGAWGSDMTCIPMCRFHHTEIETTGPTAFEMRHNVNVWREAFESLLKYMRLYDAID